MNRHMYFRQQEKNYLAHHGIKGQRWGIRRFQNPDGTLTPEGKERYGRMGEQVKRANVFTYNTFGSKSQIKKRAIDELDFTEEKNYVSEFSKYNDDANKKFWDEAEKDVNPNKLDNTKLNKFIDDEINKYGYDASVNGYYILNDIYEKNDLSIFPNAEKSIKAKAKSDYEYGNEIKNLTDNIIAELGKDYKQDITNKLIKDLGLYAIPSEPYKSEEEAIKKETEQFLNIQAYYNDNLQEYIEKYAEKFK